MNIKEVSKESGNADQGAFGVEVVAGMFHVKHPFFGAILRFFGMIDII